MSVLAVFAVGLDGGAVWTTPRVDVLFGVDVGAGLF
jgi:hypothetical protein